MRRLLGKNDNHKKKQTTTRKWGITTQLVDPFETLKKRFYIKDEITLLISQFSQSNHPISKEILKLLHATNKFLSATTLEPLFKDLRKGLTL